MMRFLLPAMAAVLFVAAPADAARKTSCAKLYKRCMTYNSGYGPAEVKLCEQQRGECLKTGEWHSPAFDEKGVEKK